MKLLIVLILSVLILGSCGTKNIDTVKADLPSTPTISPTNTITPTAIATAKPIPTDTPVTESPTPTITLAPTPSPTPAPTNTPVSTPTNKPKKKAEAKKDYSDWVLYSTGDLKLLARNILEGNVIFDGEQYWCSPEYFKMIQNEEVVYYNDIADDTETTEDFDLLTPDSEFIFDD